MWSSSRSAAGDPLEARRHCRPSAPPAAWAVMRPTDPNVIALLEARTPVCTVVGKTSLLHVRRSAAAPIPTRISVSSKRALRIWLPQGRRVFYDAEHFFDGYQEDAAYAVRDAAGRPSAAAPRRW
ncbi:MAG: hypothetical protein MZV64_49070 [Ignavibacteriales bacterium]|nr:hypothetical protein [Ignavibacteriales bacterium]